jgi:hypothetical protein
VSIFNYSFSNVGRLDRLLTLVNSDFYLAIAKSTSWDSTWGDNVDDTNPPFPQPKESTIPEILLYKKPFYQTLAVESQCGVIEFTNCGESINTPKKLTLIDLSVTTQETLELIAPTHIYFKVDLTSGDLALNNIESFRVASLIRNPTFTNPGFIRYLPSDLVSSGVVYWTTYFTPIISTVNKTTTFEIDLSL